MKSKTMRALWLDETPTFRNDVPIPTPVNKEAVVKVSLAGICGTDLQLVNGYYPFKGILGHEFVGHIVQAPGNPSREGERVVGEINVACGICPPCQHDHRTHCDRRKVLGIKNLNGAFADYLCLPLNNLIAVPETVSDECAVFTEPLAAALQILEQVKICPTNRVLVIGAGRLGQLVARVISPSGCRLHVVARYPKQKRLLELNAINVIHEDDISERAFDIVIEATGSPEGFDCARRAIRPRGCVVLKSTYQKKVKLDLSALVVREVTLVGSRCGPLLPALRLLEKKLVNPRDLIDQRFSLGEAGDALKQAAQPGALKVLLDIDSTGDIEDLSKKKYTSVDLER